MLCYLWGGLEAALLLLPCLHTATVLLMDRIWSRVRDCGTCGLGGLLFNRSYVKLHFCSLLRCPSR